MVGALPVITEGEGALPVLDNINLGALSIRRPNRASCLVERIRVVCLAGSVFAALVSMACACAVGVAAPSPAAISSLAPRRSLRVNCRHEPRLPASARSSSARARFSRNPAEAGAGRIPQDDSSYLWKLGFGSVGGAAAIKYGSILFPDITRPNIVQALLMVSLPVAAAVFILLKLSSTED